MWYRNQRPESNRCPFLARWAVTGNPFQVRQTLNFEMMTPSNEATQQQVASAVTSHARAIQPQQKPRSTCSPHIRLRKPRSVPASRRGAGEYRARFSVVGGSDLRRLISRKLAMRWRGVRLRSREGQTTSQKPHSMQASTMGDAGGDGFKNLVCASGSYPRHPLPSALFQPVDLSPYHHHLTPRAAPPPSSP